MNKNYEAAIKLAEKYYQEGKFIEAIATCRQIIQTKPDFASAHHIMGNIFFAQGKIDLASQAYHQAIELNPNLASTYANLGNIFYQQGNLDEAINHYNKATALNPNLAEPYWNLAKVLHRKGREQQAIICQEVALELKPSLGGVETHQRLGNLLAEQGQLDGAIRSYQRGLQINPNVAEIHLNLGVCWKKQGKLTAAVQSYQQAIALNANLFEAYFNLGNALEALGENKQAIAAYLQSLQIKPNLLAAYYKIAACLKKLGRNNEAKICYDSQLPPNLLTEFLPGSSQVAVKSLFEPNSDIEIEQIYPGTKINLQSAIALENPLDPDFNLSEYQFSPAFVARVPEARIWVDSENIAAIDSENQLIPELSQGSPGLILTSKKLPPPISIDGTVALLSVRDGHNYFHWMFDLLPRFELLQRSGMNLAEVDKFIVNSYQSHFQKDTLDLLGIPQSKLIESCQISHIHAKQILVPSIHRESDRITNWGRDFLRRKFLLSSLSSSPSRIYSGFQTDRGNDKGNQENMGDSLVDRNPSSGWRSQPKERIYISRKSAQYRRVLNEPDLIKFLSTYGFKAVTLESLSFREQVALMANASIIVSPHGAGLTNLIFCQPSSTIIEIFSPDYRCNLYWLISNLSQLKYYYLIGESLEQYYLASGQAKPEYIHPAGEDILVNISALLSLMQLAGAI